jgi:hypothetical protein
MFAVTLLHWHPIHVHTKNCRGPVRIWETAETFDLEIEAIQQQRAGFAISHNSEVDMETWG